MDDNYSEHDLQKETLADLAGLFADSDKIFQYKDHPDQGILRAYVTNRLLDGPRAGRVGMTFRDEQAFQAFLRGRLLRWTRPDVSMHILTCQICQQQVARLRESRWQLLASARRTQEPRERSWRQRFAIGALGGAAVAAVVATLWLLPGTSCQNIEDDCWRPIVQKEMDRGVMALYKPPGRF
jgi:hypothetical protein